MSNMIDWDLVKKTPEWTQRNKECEGAKKKEVQNRRISGE